MVFYRKYRPQKIEELDSKDVRDKLYSVLESPSIPHAFLFTGSKGLGKTSTARIVAKALNCEELRNEKGEMKNKKKNSHLSSPTSHLRSVEPCNKCEQCVSIMHGTNLDILEIDGASNRGIDEIRDLREKIKLSALRARKKVYIIDEVHMLTQEAFNALLKTLEEPPSHVVFILCTTEPHKVPSTILSRCLHIQFRKAGKEELVRSFERIIKAEKLKSDKEALNLIASLSDASFRDGAKLLEEMSLLAGRKKITKELVEKNYQVASIQYQIAQMIRNFENRDTKNALENVTKIVKDGIEMGHFMQKLIETLHNSMLFKAGVQQNLEFRIENSELGIQDLKRLIELLSKAYSELKYAVLPQIPLELMIVEWGSQERPQASPAPMVRGPVAGFPPAHLRQDYGGQASASAALPLEAFKLSGVGSPSSRATPALTPIITTQQGIANYNSNEALWTGLIDKVKFYNHSVAGVLRGCRIKSYDDKSLIIETNFKFHKDKLSERKTQEILEKACQEITKKNVEITVLLKEK